MGLFCGTHLGPGGGYSDIFMHAKARVIFFGVQNFEFRYFWRFSEKMRGMKILWIFFGGHHKMGLYLGVISMDFRVFS